MASLNELKATLVTAQKVAEVTEIEVTAEDESVDDLNQALDLLEQFLFQAEDLLELNKKYVMFSPDEKGSMLTLCGETLTFLNQWGLGTRSKES